MIKFNVEFTNKTPIYMELYNYIKGLILNKTLTPNEKLPSKRVLSTYLGISLNTVIEAYNLLLDEELIISIPKKGYYVSKYDISISKDDTIDSLESNIKKCKYDFSTKNIDSSIFPYYTWNKICKNIIYNDNILIKSDNFGNIKLRKTIANYLYENKGIKINPRNIIIGSGIEYLLTILINMLNINRIGIENPGYDKIYKILNNNNKEAVLCNLDNDGIIINDDVDALYITPSNQFPTGIKTSMKRKLELAKWAKNNKYIIEDDFDSEFKYLSNQSISLIELAKDNTILLSTYSRTISPALRISYMILPDKLYNDYYNKYSFYSTTVSTLDQLILAEYISSGAYSRHLNKTKYLYKQKRELIISILEKYDYISIDYQNSYLSLIITIINLDKQLFKKLCNDNSIDISLMDDYYLDKRKDNRIVIGYSGIDINDINEGINKLIEIINKSIKK
ncbi:MAG: PLP-dependent aminotransferase family protein [Acholeplasmatales bacterium]|nr:PLP-dependent aminotransferase family protein [Acholeplasmatales bacterium]